MLFLRFETMDNDQISIKLESIHGDGTAVGVGSERKIPKSIKHVARLTSAPTKFVTKQHPLSSPTHQHPTPCWIEPPISYHTDF